MTKLAGVFTLAAACAIAQTIEGAVTNSVTGDGIPGIAVDIGQPGKWAYSSTTDAAGHFRIDQVKPGTYTVRYFSPHFWPEPGLDAPRLFQVTAGGDPVKLEARLIPLGTIAGRVVDSKGKAVPGAQLQLNDPFPEGSEADAAGGFQMEDLPPGVYTLSAIPPAGWKPPDPEPGSDQGLGWTRTFYPGVSRPEAALEIVLQPGGGLTDIELKLLTAPARAIRGAVLNPDGTPAARVAIHLAEDPPPVAPMDHAESRPDGAFEFPAVVDGEWRLAAEVERGGVRLQAVQWIEIAGRDQENVVLRLSPPLAVTGQAIMETPKGMTAPQPPAVFLDRHISRFRRESAPVFFSRPAFPLGPPSRPDADGHFSIREVYPGSYRIVPGDPFDMNPPGYYLDSVRVGDTELSAPEVDISGPLSIALVYKTSGGRVRGTVENCASGVVLLLPRDPARRLPGFFRGGRCDSHDRYEIADVRPGDYYALALAGAGRMLLGLLAPAAGGLRLAYARALAGQFDNGLLNQAASVTVRAGEPASADLRAVTQMGH